MQDKIPQAKCPHCHGSGVFQGENPRGVYQFRCYSCQQAFALNTESVGPACPKCHNRNTTLDHIFPDRKGDPMGTYKCHDCHWIFLDVVQDKYPQKWKRPEHVPASYQCPICEQQGRLSYGNYVRTDEDPSPRTAKYHLYRCTVGEAPCGREFAVLDEEINPPVKPMGTITGRVSTQAQTPMFRRPTKRDLKAAHDAEVRDQPWRPAHPKRWEEHAQPGPLGVKYWWPCGLSQERREEFMADAIKLLGMVEAIRPGDTDELVYSVADNLFRLWWEGICRGT